MSVIMKQRRCGFRKQPAHGYASSNIHYLFQAWRQCTTIAVNMWSGHQKL